MSTTHTSWRRFLRGGSAGIALAGALAFSPAPLQADDLTVSPIGVYDHGSFDESAAEIAAYDPKHQRLYVVNGDDDRIDVLDLSNPANPSLQTTIDVSDYGAANSVAVHGKIVAIAVNADADTAPGIVRFYDTDGHHLTDVTVGILPDMVTFSPNGRYVLTANEGEPNGDDVTDNPVGSISIIPVNPKSTKAVAALTDADVTTLDFSPWNAAPPAGVRANLMAHRGATFAQDVEPEYIAVSPDSARAYVTLQENNAIAIVDLKSRAITAIVPLGLKDWHVSRSATLTKATIKDLPPIGVTDAGQTIDLGGFSGLYFDGHTDDGKLKFVTHPDRGPNADLIGGARPFALPDFQLELVHIEYDPATKEAVVTDRTALYQPNGADPITGLPNRAPGTLGLAHTDEIPVDLAGNPLPYDPFGGDLEGVVRDDDGNYWICDEYRPSIYKFGPDGVMLDRYVPTGANDGTVTGTEALPGILAQRRINRGFEAIAYADGKIYAWVQSPLDNPDLPNDANSKAYSGAGSYVRMIAFDPGSESTDAMYLVPLEGGGSDKVGDAVALGSGRFLMLERDSAIGEGSAKKVFMLDTNVATNLLDIDEGTLPSAPEAMSPAALAGEGVIIATKKLWIDIGALGYNEVDKPEGLALIDKDTLAVINDNDFQLAGSLNSNNGKIDVIHPPVPTILGIVDFESVGFDGGKDDGRINIQPWPVVGLYMPDAIETISTGAGHAYYAIANEGDAREYGDLGGAYASFADYLADSSDDSFFDEGEIDGDHVVLELDDVDLQIPLDPDTYPPHLMAFIGSDDGLNGLKISVTDGLNSDGQIERLHTFGGRSFSILDESGQMVYDSGSLLECITAEALPENFNASNDDGDLDDRSDNKGPEPEGLEVGKIGGKTYLFVGLERVGGFAVFDVTDPTAPLFVLYENSTRDFGADQESPAAGDLGPEGLLFISEADSPTGVPLLIVTNEVSGTTRVFQLTISE